MKLNTVSDMEQVIRIATALSSKTRLRIINVLAREPSSLSQISEALGGELYESTVYRHLENLEEAGVVKKEYNSETKVLEYHLINEKVGFDFSPLK